MSIQNTQFTDENGKTFSTRVADRASRRRLGLFDPDLRARNIELRERFADTDGDTLSDAEMLELVLMRGMPYDDCKPLALELLAEFGDFGSVMSADRSRIKNLAGSSAVASLQLIHCAARRLAKGRITNRPLVSSWDALLDYCRTTMAHRETEEFRVLFLDRRNMLISDEVMGSGTVDHVPVYPREVLKRALEVNACAIILIHNHPSGDPTPSECDIEMTTMIKNAAESLSITLHDHLIIGANTETSFVSQGLL